MAAKIGGTMKHQQLPEFARRISRFADTAEWILATKSPAQIREMAMTSALWTVRNLGTASVRDVMHQQGLAELNAKRALEDLVHADRCGVSFRSGVCWYYELKDGETER
jgi:hypothetical protein